MRRLIGRPGFLWLLGLFAVLAAAGEVRADSLPALSGMPYLDSDSACFTRLSSSNRVTNTGCGTVPRTWLIGFPVRPTVNLEVFASATGSGTPPSCRVVVRSASDTSVTFGSSFNIGTDTQIGFAHVNSSSDTAHVDCLLTQNQRGVTGIRWIIH